MRRPALAAAVLLSLAACGREEPAAPADAAATAKPDSPIPAGTAERLAFVDERGAPRLLLDCLAAPRPRLQASVAEFEKIMSEDRLTVGAGDEAFAFAADLSAPGPGVVGSMEVDGDLLRRIADGRPVRAVYGAQRIGPLQPADGVSPGSFVVRCRELAGD